MNFFGMDWHVWLMIGVLWAVTLLYVRKKREGEGFFTRIFKDNKDFDSTLDRVSITLIILFMLISFHDDFGDPTRAAQITIIFMGLLNLYQAMVTGKAVRDMQNGQGEVRQFEPEAETEKMNKTA